jgi:hypothetical protein
MGISLLEAVFGCLHRNTTFPQTPIRRTGNAAASPVIEDTYVACLDCGRKLAYDWNTMRAITSGGSRPVTPIRRAVSWVRFIVTS